MIPGMPKEMKDAQIGDDQVTVTEAIIRSMTPDERARPEMINGSRRSRIALGSGTQVADVNRLVKQFSEMQKMMKKWVQCPKVAGARPPRKRQGQRQGFQQFAQGNNAPVERHARRRRPSRGARKLGTGRFPELPELPQLKISQDLSSNLSKSWGCTPVHR